MSDISGISNVDPATIEGGAGYEDLYIHAINLTCSIKAQKNDLDRIIELLKEGKLKVRLRKFELDFEDKMGCKHYKITPNCSDLIKLLLQLG